jgi:hypothetical protein
MRIAFVSADGLVRNVIVAANVDERTKTIFLDQARAVSDAAVAIEIADDEARVWIGGTYDAEQGFLPPPQPEVIEGTSEVIEEPVAMIEETTEELLASEVLDDALPG